MPIEAKKLLLNKLEQTFGNMLTSNQVNDVLNAISDELVGYTVEKNSDMHAEPDDFLDAFISAKQIEGRSPKTLERYRYIVEKFRAATNVQTRSITVFHLRKYLADQKMRGLSDGTLEGMREIFSSYFNWLYREGLINSNPCANLGVIKNAKKVKEIYSDTDMEKMKYNCKSLRDRAIVAFLDATGCRISEMTQLNRSDIDFKNMECLVLGKGNKERTVYMTPVASMLLCEYLNQRTDNELALFVGKGTRRLQPGGVRYMLKTLEQRSHVNHIYPHKFRRTRATTMIRHGMPVQEVAAILGHEKLDTTMEYVVLDNNDIKNAYRKYS